MRSFARASSRARAAAAASSATARLTVRCPALESPPLATSDATLRTDGAAFLCFFVLVSGRFT